MNVSWRRRSITFSDAPKGSVNPQRTETMALSDQGNTSHPELTFSLNLR